MTAGQQGEGLCVAALFLFFAALHAKHATCVGMGARGDVTGGYVLTSVTELF